MTNLQAIEFAPVSLSLKCALAGWTSNLYHTGLAQELRRCLEPVVPFRPSSKPRSLLTC